jgi:hypothetical protein
METKSFIDVDALLPQITLQQAAHFYGVSLPELKKVGTETRTACFLNCGKKSPTGDRAVAIQAEHPSRQWHCHAGGCGKGGNLVSLCDLMKPGANAGGRPRGERFKDIAKDLKAMAEGQSRSTTTSATPLLAPAPKLNLPLKDSENERARGLVNLDAKCVVEANEMSPKAAGYFRRRSFLTPEVCKRWRMGYLPRDTGEDKSGGTMRGKIVYPCCDATGDVLTWFGRDPEFEEKHRQWEATGRTEKAPEKYHYVKGFHRGLELFGLHHLLDEKHLESIQKLGLILVEGPNDVIRLDTLGVPAVALCSQTITREQAAKAALLARELARGIITLLLDCDPEGLDGMKQCLDSLAQLVPVRLAWTDRMHGGKFHGRQPESLSLQEWQEIESFLSQ